MHSHEWVETQHRLAAGERWIMDGDLGPYHEIWVRLHRADTVVVLDLPLAVCAWRVIQRGPEQVDFWRWMLTWRRKSRPRLLADIARHAPQASLHVLHSARDTREFLSRI